MRVIQGGFFFRKRFLVETATHKWSVSKKGKDPYLYEIREKTVVGKKLYSIGFKKRHNEGMFNGNEADSFEWKKLEGASKGWGWHLDGMEVIRFEKRTWRKGQRKGYVTQILNGRQDEGWLAAMVATGFLAMG